jgi:L-amino acid N-acyltransferase YncA
MNLLYPGPPFQTVNKGNQEDFRLFVAFSMPNFRHKRGKDPMTIPVVRDAAEEDLPAIQAIYSHHVLHGLGTFELDPPPVAEMTRRWQGVTEQGMPYLVSVDDGRVTGYAYAGPYRPRPAYRFAVENSVYIAPDGARRGYGRLLVSALIERCTALGHRQMLAVIGDRGNDGSIGLHRSLGFEEVGSLPAVGYKHDRWVDVVIMQRALGPGATVPPEER